MHLSSGKRHWKTEFIEFSATGKQKFPVLKVLTEVMKFSTNGFNYPDNFLLHLPGY